MSTREEQDDELELIYAQASDGVVDPLAKLRERNPQSLVLKAIEGLGSHPIAMSLDESLTVLYQLQHRGIILAEED